MEHRKAWRNAMSLAVLCEGADQSVELRISDVSVKGAYIATRAPLAVGSKVKLAFALPNGFIIKAAAIVAHSEPNQGMGVEFNSLSDDDVERIRRFIHS
jgi:uncharacterized protein (TIGR02266 family)